MLDFEIKENLVITKNAVIAVFQIEPIDIFLMNTQDQETFFARLQSTFQLLKGHIQINVVVKRMDLQDYTPYFQSLKKQNVQSEKKLSLVTRMISEFTELIEDKNEVFLSKKFYLHMKERCTTDKDKLLLHGIKQLDQHVEQLTSSLFQAGISSQQVLEPDLISYIKKYYA